MQLVVEVLEKRILAGRGVVWAHPEDSLVWKLQKVKDLFPSHPDSEGGVSISSLSLGPGSSEPKLRVLSNLPGLREELRGSRAVPTTKLQGSVPERLAHAVLRGRPSDGVPFSPPLASAVPALRKREGPPMPSDWGDPGRYRVLIMGSWTRREHSNVLEARTGIMTMRHVTRTASGYRKRHLLVTDSKASLGAFCKGRSSARSFTGLCRRASALKFATGCAFFWRYIETWRNAADGPSRGQRWPGVYGGAPPRFS
jgi:hypothetical protein